MAKTELEEAGLETDGMVESTAKLRSEILALSGVDIMENDNTFKSTYKIMDELAVKWKDLTDIQQASITELIAGKRQGNIVSSLMTNFDTARDALETSLNSAGSAMAEHEKWQKSLEAQILKLKASWQGLSQAFLKSDFLHGALSAVIGLLDGLTKLIDTFGTLPALLGVVAAGFSAFKNKGLFTFDKDAKSIQLFGTQLSGLGAKYASVHSKIVRYNSLSATSQEALRKKWANSNTTFGKYISGLKGSKASFTGYIGSLVGATIKTVALEAATIALNAALTMGISFAIQAIITAFDKWHVSAKELAEQVDELTSKFQEQHNELRKLKGDYDTANESSMISKYEKLSKGVDNLGRNVSLTADEYSEYQSIVNKIAEQIPSLVTGYDSQGNALLSVKGNVEELTEAYEKLIHAQNQEILTNAGDIEKDFANTIKKADFGGWEKFWEAMPVVNWFTSDDLNTDTVKQLEKMLSGEIGVKDLNYGVSDAYAGRRWDEVRKALKGAGVDIGFFEDTETVLKKTLKNDPAKIKGIIDNYYAQFADAVEEQKTIAQAKLSEAFDISNAISALNYGNISEELQALAYQTVNSLDFDFLSNLSEKGKSLEEWTTEMLDQLNAIGESDNAQIEAAFDLQTKFNGGEISYGEYVQSLKDVEKTIDGLNLKKTAKNQLKISLGLDDGGVIDQYNALKKRLTSDEYNIQMSTKEAEEFLNGLNASEYQVAVDLIADEEIDFSNFDIDSFKEYIKEQAKLNEALNFNTDIKIDTTALEALNTALAESASAMGLSEESIDSLKAKYSDLEGYNPHTLFEKTANGVKVNREELAKLEQKYNDLTKTEVQEHLDTLVEEYNKCTKAIDGNIGSQEKLELISKREKYAQQIEELAEYQAQLEGVTGAYQRWLNAQETPEDYEGYELVATSREDIEDEIDRGFISNATKEYIDLLSGEDLVGGTIDDYADAWARLDKKVGNTSYSIHDFFTVNDDGDITATGIDRFFKGLQQDFKGEVAKFNEKSGKWEYNFSQENLQKIQDEWGIGIEAIELLLEAAASAGYDIDWGGMFDDLDIDMSNFESVEAMISLAEKAQEEFNKLDGIEDVEFNFRTNNVEEATTEVEKARKAYLDLITNDDGSLNLKAEGAEQMQFILATLLTQKQQLSTPAIMKVDTSQIDKAKTDVIDVINKAKALQTAYENYEIAITTGVDVESAKADLNSAIEGMKGTSVDVRADLKLPTNEELTNAANGIGSIKVGASLDGTSIGAIATKIQTECTPEVIAKVTGLDESAVASESHQVVYTAEHTDVDNFINSLSDISKKIIYKYTTEGTKPNPKNIERTITYEYKTKGDVPEAYGTAHSKGTANSGRAFSRGNWGIKGNGVALGGELGQELVVRDGRFFTVGDTGAEFFHYKHNDIVFNAAQTESLFKYGGIKGAKPRGTMLAGGTAFAGGSSPSSGKAFAWTAQGTSSRFTDGRLRGSTVKEAPKTKTKVTTKKNSVTTTTETTWDATASGSSFSENRSNNSPSSGTSSDTKDKFEDTIDWIEVILDRAERAIDKYEKQADNVYKTWAKRNKALEKEITEVGSTIDLYEQAKKRYLSEANSVGLSEAYKNKVRNGTLDIQDFKGDADEKLVEKIKNYQDLYNKYLDCVDKIEELKEKEASLYAQRFENVSKEYDNLLQAFDHTESMLNEYISQAEAKGRIVSKNYYEALISNEQKRINTLKQEQSALIKARDEAVASGEFDKYSEEWYSMCAAIDDVTQAIEAGTTSIIEYNNAIRDLDFEKFDLIQERMSDITAEADFLIELMSNKKLFDDNGKMTDEGQATVGLHAQNYNTYMYQADNYNAKIAEIDRKIASGELDGYSKDVIDKRREYVELQREAILNAEQEKNAIKDLVQEGIDLELDSLSELIDKYNEALQSQKDLYDYQKRVEEQTKNIASLQKQLASLEGDNSEESRKRIQELKLELSEAEEELAETEYEKFIQDSEQLLTSLYDQYELLLNERIDNTDYLIAQQIEAVNANASTISTTLETVADEVGTALSTEMEAIWGEGGKAKSVVTLYGDNFQNKLTTTNTTLAGIKNSVDTMVASLNKEAQKTVTTNKTTTSAQKDPTKNTDDKKPATPPTQTNTNKTGGDGKANVGDKVKFVSGKYYYDSQGKTPAGAKYQGKEVYITSINTKSWATHPYHISTGKKLGSGDLGWLKLNQLSGYATGKKNFSNDEIAWTQENGQEFIVRPSDGAILTPVAKGDSVLTSAASRNIWNMANNPAEFIKNNLSLGSTSVPNNSTVQNSVIQNFENVTFSMPNVRNYDELIRDMQKDPNFERLVEAMTIGKLAGKSSLAKGKAIR